MSINSFTIVISALATYRVVRLVTVEEGPFGLAQKLRNITDPDQRTWIGRGMACPWCISFWLAPVAVYTATYAIGLLFIAGLAVSALVGLSYAGCNYLLYAIERMMKVRNGR